MRIPTLVYIATAIGLLHPPARAQNLDKELATLAESLATQIKESGKKKISVLDFSDLQGNFNELGRFIAEKLTVDMVSRRKGIGEVNPAGGGSSRHGYSMVDRANLKRILDEHKLTMSGLVDPENAKKLGQLAGVDAIILGNVIPFKTDVQITAKLIATDTAEILGAGEGRVARDAELTELLGRGISSENTLSVQAGADQESGGARVERVSKKIFLDDDLAAELASFSFLENGDPMVNLTLKNLNKQNAIRVGLNADREQRVLALRAFVLDDRGNKASLKKSSGITNPPFGDFGETVFKCMVNYPKIYSGFEEFLKPMLNLEAGESLQCSLEFAFLNGVGKDKIGDTFRLQAEVIVAETTAEARPKLYLSKVCFEDIRPARLKKQ